jgi:4-hydroxyproline epimerase
MDVVHPQNPAIKGVNHCMWTGAPLSAESQGRAVVIAGASLIDRSPCGTGSSARVAQRFARGWQADGAAYRHESLIGSFFVGRVAQQLQLENGTPAIRPSIEGRAWITGRAEFIVDDTQPWWDGFSLQDYAAPASAKETSL